MSINKYYHNFDEPLYVKNINLDNVVINTNSLSFNGSLNVSGNINAGIVTASLFVGDGSGALDITSSLFT